MIYVKDGDISSLDRPVILTTYGSPPERMACDCRTRTPSVDMLTLNSEGVLCRPDFPFSSLGLSILMQFFGGSCRLIEYVGHINMSVLLLFPSDPLLGMFRFQYPGSCDLIDSSLPSQLNVRPLSADNSTFKLEV